MRYLLLLLSLITSCLWSGSAFSQKQTNIWYFGDARAGLDFNESPPKVLNNGAMVTSESTATMSDSTGKLLFYTNGVSIWNKNHSVMANGTGIDGHASARQGTVIVPQPGSKTRYFVFTTDALENQLEKGLRYSIIDMSRSGGMGEVVTKNVLLHPLAEENVTAAGGCGCKNAANYWVAADRKDRPGLLYAYQISANGVNSRAVESYLPQVASITFMKFAPSGERIAFTGLNNAGESIIGIADFDQVSGKAANVKLLPVLNKDFHRAIEFSSDGKLLYFTTWSSPQLTQYDLTKSSVEEIARTAVALVELPEYNLNSPQLASNGKIYISTYEGQKQKTGIAVIERPNLLGKASLFRPDVYPGIGAYMFPNFLTGFLYRNDFLVEHTDAGPDRKVCVDAAVKLGGESDSRLRYSWSPGSFLSDSTVADPVFRYTGDLDSELTLEYVLTVADGPCIYTDTVLVEVHPLLDATLSGPVSVCPGVQGVTYSVNAKEGYSYRWTVSGGTITSGNGTGAITVDWGQSNSTAWVEVIPVNKLGCAGMPVRHPVRVNVELDTEMPQGQTRVCINQRTGNSYKLTGTAGSIYTWGTMGGKVISGQGTASVVIDWDKLGVGKVWVQEYSTTIDTVCYGVSDTLYVSIFMDTTALTLDVVSVSTEEGTEAGVQWQVKGMLSVPGEMSLQRRVAGTSQWMLVESLPNTSHSYSDTGLKGRENSYEYRTLTRNDCGEEITSAIHQTMLLMGNADHQQETITLNWNAYEGWPDGVAYYEVWRKLDNESDYTLLQTLDSKTLSLDAISTVTGFKHHYRIRAVASEKQLVSWSNSVVFDFQHALLIPNIFTPNGDGYNDTFSIPKLELYPENELVISNRTGQEVYRQKAYQGSWNGSNVVAGTYYYVLYVSRLDKYFKGWLEIIR